MASRNSLAEIDNSFSQNINRLKRKNEDAFQTGSNSNKRSCLKNSNQQNINKNEKMKKMKRFKSKLKNASDENEKLSHELTPCSTISSSGYRPTLESLTPLPNFTWADAPQVWNLMLKNDQIFKRESSLFNFHPSLQPAMRAMLLDWLNEVCQAYNLSRQTYYLALDFFDRYLSVKKDMPKKRLQLLGITCLFIASKIEEIFPPKLDRFSFVCDGACNDDEIITKELVVLNTLKWELYPTTPISWLNIYMQIYSSMDKENLNQQIGESFLIPDFQSKLFVQIAHLIDLCTLDSGSLGFPYSVIAASAFYHFTNENVVSQCSGKSMSEMSACIEWMIPFAIAIKNEGLDFVNRLPLEEDRSTTIQTHTVSLELLQNAQSIQADIESEKLEKMAANDSSENTDVSLYSSLTPSKMPLTPPRTT